MTDTYIVSRARAGMELDEFLCLQYPEWTKGFIRRQVRQGAVLVDGRDARPSKRLRTNQVLMVDIDESEAPLSPVAPTVVVGQELAILHEADDWLVIDKPAGIAVEPERWARRDPCVSGALLQYARARPSQDDGVEERMRIVHRLDKETSGALIVAKNIEAERHLRSAFEHGLVRKRYLALVEGEHPLADGESELIDRPIGPDPRKNGRMVIRPDDEKASRRQRGKASRTRIRVARRFRGYTLLACEPLTGRTHQIRVHLADHGYPLAVDKVYGRRDELLLSQLKSGYRPKAGRPEVPLIARLTLHAERVAVPPFGSPAGTEPVEVVAPLPTDFERLLKHLEKSRSLRR